MGNYTRFEFLVTLDQSMPTGDMSALRAMVVGDAPSVMPDHLLFATPHWSCVVGCESAYHPTERCGLFLDDGQLFLRVSSSLKNYDREIQLFLDWIGPHVTSQDGLLGFIEHHAEYARHCSLIAVVDSQLKMLDYDEQDYSMFDSSFGFGPSSQEDDALLLGLRMPDSIQGEGLLGCPAALRAVDICTGRTDTSKASLSARASAGGVAAQFLMDVLEASGVFPDERNVDISVSHGSPPALN